MAAVFKSFDQIEIDGIASGNIVDVISNHAPKRAEVLAAYNVFTDKLNADHAEALATVEADLAITTSQLEATTQAKSALEDQVATLTTEKQSLTTDLATANATVAKLTAIRQYNPRWTTPDSFINRFTVHEAKAFYSSNDPIIVGGRELLEEYETATPPYHVDLDDEQVQGLTGYMVQLGMMTIERRAQVLRDATAQEAVYPA